MILIVWNSIRYKYITSFEQSFSKCTMGKICFLIIITFNSPVKAMKSSQFYIKNTHLQDIERIEKLVLLASHGGFCMDGWCHKVKIYLNLDNPNQNNINLNKFLSCT